MKLQDDLRTVNYVAYKIDRPVKQLACRSAYFTLPQTVYLPFLYHQLTRTHTVLTGRKTPMPLQSPCQYTKYCLRAFHCLTAFLLRQNCCAPDSDGFLCDFWFLSRRRADARQGEKDKKHPAHSMQSPAKWVCMEKEEGDCLVQLLPQGGSGTAQASSDVVRRVCSCQLMVHKDIYIGSRCLILLTQRK